MRIALAQLNYTIGDFSNNLEKIRQADKEAAGRKADIIVFSELALTGYPPRDLLEDPMFVAEAEKALFESAQTFQTPWAVLGGIRSRIASTGRPLENCAFLISGGKVKAHRAKSLLPSYDVFDEERYFEPARQNRALTVLGKKIGLTVCEDLWADYYYGGHKRYSRDPIMSLAGSKVELLFNISASPFERGKGMLRDRLAAETAKKYNMAVALVNQVGGNDELVFDGRSLLVSETGHIIARAPEFEEEILVLDLDSGQTSGEIKNNLPLSDIESVQKALVCGIRDYCRKCGFKSVVVGLSGGIDSAVTVVLASEALGPSNVLGVTMPSPYSSRGSVEDSRILARNLGIRFIEAPIEKQLNAFRNGLLEHLDHVEKTLVEENLQARIRGTILMAFANAERSLVLATGNKSELATGYCTLYGDMAGGLAPLSDLFKTSVYELANLINRQKNVIPTAIIQKAPSAELSPGQKDTDTLPPYEVLDRILSVYLDKVSASEEPLDDVTDQLLTKIASMLDSAEYKRRQAPPGLKISSKAFGSGRRVPIAQKYKRR
ncbi:MAG: NAD+ synthase [Deltaproteobacteria bacterium]|nr:NAD+ synthase [Deltaproteobacteria bacterium]